MARNDRESKSPLVPLYQSGKFLNLSFLRENLRGFINHSVLDTESRKPGYRLPPVWLTRAMLRGVYSEQSEYALALTRGTDCFIAALVRQAHHERLDFTPLKVTENLRVVAQFPCPAPRPFASLRVTGSDMSWRGGVSLRGDLY